MITMQPGACGWSRIEKRTVDQWDQPRTAKSPRKCVSSGLILTFRFRRTLKIQTPGSLSSTSNPILCRIPKPPLISAAMADRHFTNMALRLLQFTSTRELFAATTIGLLSGTQFFTSVRMTLNVGVSVSRPQGRAVVPDRVSTNTSQTDAGG